MWKTATALEAHDAAAITTTLHQPLQTLQTAPPDERIQERRYVEIH